MPCPTTRHIETAPGADAAVLEFLSRRVEAIALTIAAWTPQTAICTDAQYCLADAIDRVRDVISLASQGVHHAEHEEFV